MIYVLPVAGPKEVDTPPPKWMFCLPVFCLFVCVTNRARHSMRSMRGGADRRVVAAVSIVASIAAAASLAWLSRRRHRRRLAYTEAHVLAAMLCSGAISSAALQQG